VARTVMRAEALAKAVLITGSESGLALINEFEDAEAILVLDDRSMLYSSNIEAYL
jgi:thiamine biosynthesis lipoprotein ApbE